MRVAALLAAIALLGGACGGRSSESTSPPVTADRALQETLGLRALQAEDLRGVPDLADAVATPPQRLAAPENPDQRGPCGAPLAQPPALDQGVLVTMRGRAFQLVEIVSAPSEPEMDAYLDAVAADLHTGCPPFESTNEQGLTQRISDVVGVDVAGVGDRAVAWTSAVDVREGRVYGGLVIVRVGPRLAVVQLYAGVAPPPEMIRGLAEAAARRLAA